MGSGKSVNLWNDRCLGELPLSIFPQEDMNMEVMVDTLIVNDAWVIPHHLPLVLKNYLSQKILVLHQPGSVVPDFAVWSMSSSSIYNLRLAWDLIRSYAPICSWTKVVWHNILQPATSFFVGAFAITGPHLLFGSKK